MERKCAICKREILKDRGNIEEARRRLVFCKHNKEGRYLENENTSTNKK